MTILVSLIGIVAFGADVPDAATLKASWERHRAAMTELAVLPLTFTEEEWAEVAKGEVARRRERLEGTDRVIGLIWVPADMDTTWIAVQDDHMDITKGYFQDILPGSKHDDSRVYARLNVPWPFATRHWVIHIVNNGPLREKTGGAVWERNWTLDTETPTYHRDNKGVWLDVNEGGWYYVKSGEGTLLAYHARTVVGGAIPDNLATSWAFGTLDNMLSGVAERTAKVPEHYRGSHLPILRPGSTPIARQ